MSKCNYVNISPQQGKQMIDCGNVTVVDVREQDEYDCGHIANAILIPLSQIACSAEKYLPSKTDTILLYCRSGRRSESASQILAVLGYQCIYNFGGILDWTYDIVN